MRVKHFFKTLALLTVGLIALASGVNAALDHASSLPGQSSLVVYDDAGRTLFAYSGELHDSLPTVSKGGISVRFTRSLNRI